MLTPVIQNFVFKLTERHFGIGEKPADSPTLPLTFSKQSSRVLDASWIEESTRDRVSQANTKSIQAVLDTTRRACRENFSLGLIFIWSPKSKHLRAWKVKWK